MPASLPAPITAKAVGLPQTFVTEEFIVIRMFVAMLPKLIYQLHQGGTKLTVLLRVALVQTGVFVVKGFTLEYLSDSLANLPRTFITIDNPKPYRVCPHHRPIPHIRLQVDAPLKPNRVSGQKPPRRRVKVTVR